MAHKVFDEENQTQNKEKQAMNRLAAKNKP